MPAATTLKQIIFEDSYFYVAITAPGKNKNKRQEMDLPPNL